VYSLEYADMPKALLAPHHVGSCTDVIRDNCYISGYSCRSWGSSVRIVSDYKLDCRGLIPERQWSFPLASVSRPAVRPTQPPMQWVRGSFPEGKTLPELDAYHSPHLEPRSRMCRSYTSSPLSACMAYSGTALFFFTF
jgi:hypothetical protein